MQLFYDPSAQAPEFVLNPDEARHCLKVLRKKKGEIIQVIDGKGTFYKCVIVDDNFKNCELKVVSTTLQKEASGLRHIAIAPTKNLDRIEWFVEKAVEIGVDKITFILCENSERKVLKLDRIIKKAVSAMKQSLKATLPLFSEMISIKDLLEQEVHENKYIAYVDESNNINFKDLVDPLADSLILIGPEGDFSQSEVQEAIALDFKPVSLGNSRLRTETAGIVACTFLNS